MIRFLSGFAIAGILLGSLPSVAFAQNIQAPDVLVIGGTPAGVAAAVAAGRRGLHVELDVAGDVLGGVVSDGMMDQWDRNTGPAGETIERGIFAELLARLGDAFAPERAEAVLSELVASTPNVDVHYGRIPLDALVEPTSSGHFVTRIDFRTRKGNRASVAPFVVDATDDGDVAALAGARYDVGRGDMGRDSAMQAATLMFSLRGVDTHALANGYDPRRFGPGGAAGARVWGFSSTLRDYRSTDPRVMVRDLNLGISPDGEVTVNAIDVFGVDGLDPRSTATGTAFAKAEAPHLLAFLRGRVPGFENAEIARFARALYVRETRHILGMAYLTSADVLRGNLPADTIGLSSYPLDLHPVSAEDKFDYPPLRHVYGVPLGALIPSGFTNLLVASRAISASHAAAGSARIVPTTIEEGEAAGAACAIALRERTTFPQLDRSASLLAGLRSDLAQRGAVIDLPAPLAQSSRTLARAAR
jgi:hypothetical protein